MRKYINVTFLIAAILLLFVIVAKIDVLPAIGDIDSAPALHVSKYYIEHSVQDTNSPNMVTAMIVDYRAFDTMFETTVMFLAGFWRVDQRQRIELYSQRDILVTVISSEILHTRLSIRM